MVRTMRPGDEIEMTVSRGPEIFPVHTTLEAIVHAPAMPHPGARNEEISRLKQSLQKLETETKKVEERIRELEAPPSR